MSNRRRLPNKRPGHSHERFTVPPDADTYSMEWDGEGVNLYGPGRTTFRLPRGEVVNMVSGLAAYLEHMGSPEHTGHGHVHDDDVPEFDADEIDGETVVIGLRRVFPDKTDAELLVWMRGAAEYLGVDVPEEE